MVNAIPASLMNSGLPADWQIDGNLGAPAGLAEMLVQSHEMVVVRNNNSSEGSGAGLVAVETGTVGGYQTLIRLLPTLPRAWVEVGGAGFVKGLRARGGFTVDVAWDAQGVLTSATVGSEVGGTVFVTLGRSVVGAADGVKLKSQGCVSDGFLKLETVKGGKYVVKLA
jgi:alpha-L-fucosidase 2